MIESLCTYFEFILVMIICLAVGTWAFFFIDKTFPKDKND